eukprot:14417035-Ditylum_brightwellii.AAC.1
MVEGTHALLACSYAGSKVTITGIALDSLIGGGESRFQGDHCGAYSSSGIVLIDCSSGER